MSAHLWTGNNETRSSPTCIFLHDRSLSFFGRSMVRFLLSLSAHSHKLSISNVVPGVKDEHQRRISPARSYQRLQSISSSMTCIWSIFDHCRSCWCWGNSVKTFRNCQETESRSPRFQHLSFQRLEKHECSRSYRHFVAKDGFRHSHVFKCWRSKRIWKPSFETQLMIED